MIIFLRVLLLITIITHIHGSSQAYKTECTLVNIDNLDCRDINQVLINGWSFINQKDFNSSQIHLARNRIKSIKSGIFTKFTNVEGINLGENELSAIDFNEFENNSKLVKFGLSNNQISEIISIKHSTVINITHLWIQNNNLVDISELCKLTELKVLYLSGNQMLDFSKVMFNCWSELIILDLSNTNLKNLKNDYRMLSGCNKLEDLYIDDNNLEMLCLEYFPALPQLDWINIRNNNLISLEVLRLREKFQILNDITLTGNKWSCEYYGGTLKKYLGESNIREVTVDDFHNETKCLPNSATPEVTNCPKIEHNSTQKHQGSLSAPFWIFTVLNCTILIAESVLLRYYTQIFVFDF